MQQIGSPPSEDFDSLNDVKEITQIMIVRRVPSISIREE